MLTPKRTKYRKCFKGRSKGNANKGNELAFGQYGLVALEHGKITSRQIEAARIAMTRHTKRGGYVWIKIFPHKPVTRKPAEVRMGSGKGAVDHYIANVEPGRILYEMGDVKKEVAVAALELAGSKLPIRTKLLIKEDDPWSE